MEQHNEKLSNGLRMFFQGQVIILLGVIAYLFLHFFAAGLAAILLILSVLVGGISALAALAGLRHVHPDYRNAFYVLLLKVMLSIVSSFFNEGVPGSLLDLADSLCGLLQLYFMLRATNSFLEAQGAVKQIQDGKNVWKMNLLLIGLSVVSLLVLQINETVGGVLSLVVTLLHLFYLVMYLGYLREASETL